MTAIYTILALAYIGLRHRNYTHSYLLKVAPILLLVTLAWQSADDSIRLSLVIALILSACGDIALTFDGDRPFLVGLSFFLLSHVVYMLTLVISSQTPIGLRYTYVSLIVVVIMLALQKQLDKMFIPVLFYGLVLTRMVIYSVLHDPTSILLMIGAVTFLISDSIIGIDKFLKPFPYRDELVMGTYYLAQACLVWGFLGIAYT